MKPPPCPTCGTPLAWNRQRGTYEHCHDTAASRVLVRRANKAHRRETQRSREYRARQTAARTQEAQP